MKRACAGIAAAFFVIACAPSLAADAQRDGEALFRTRCGVCHLEGGTGTFMLRRRLGAERARLENRRDLNEALIKQAVRAGIVSMPRFTRAELPDGELRAITDYLTRADASSPK